MSEDSVNTKASIFEYDHYRILPTKKFSDNAVCQVLTRYAPDERALLAKEMLLRWGLVAAMSDGEDSAGRAKLCESPPGYMVKRVCDTADLLFKEFERRGWMKELPSYEELTKIAEQNAKLIK